MVVETAMTLQGRKQMPSWPNMEGERWLATLGGAAAGWLRGWALIGLQLSRQR